MLLFTRIPENWVLILGQKIIYHTPKVLKKLQFVFLVLMGYHFTKACKIQMFDSHPYYRSQSTFQLARFS